MTEYQVFKVDRVVIQHGLLVDTVFHSIFLEFLDDDLVESVIFLLEAVFAV